MYSVLPNQFTRKLAVLHGSPLGGEKPLQLVPIRQGQRDLETHACALDGEALLERRQSLWEGGKSGA